MIGALDTAAVTIAIIAMSARAMVNCWMKALPASVLASPRKGPPQDSAVKSTHPAASRARHVASITGNGTKPAPSTVMCAKPRAQASEVAA